MSVMSRSAALVSAALDIGLCRTLQFRQRFSTTLPAFSRTTEVDLHRPLRPLRLPSGGRKATSLGS